MQCNCAAAVGTGGLVWCSEWVRGTDSVMMRLGLRERTPEKRIRMFIVWMREDAGHEVRRRDGVIGSVQTRQDSIAGWEG